MFGSLLRRSGPIALVEGLFSEEEENRIRLLRRQFLLCPDSFKLDVNYRRMQFARWLVQRGHLGEELDEYATARTDTSNVRQRDLTE